MDSNSGMVVKNATNVADILSFVIKHSSNSNFNIAISDFYECLARLVSSKSFNCIESRSEFTYLFLRMVMKKLKLLKGFTINA